MRRLGVVASVCALLALSTAAAWADGAIAVGGDRYGMVYNADGQRGAERGALDECGNGRCHIVFNFRHTCAALAGSRNGPYGWAHGDTPDHARFRAVQECRGAGGHGCRPVAARCDN